MRLSLSKPRGENTRKKNVISEPLSKETEIAFFTVKLFGV
jgi:hypothetical protein